MSRKVLARERPERRRFCHACARSELIYRYDGTLDGLLCCVFESYAHKELPGDIVIQGEAVETLLFEGKAIPTDQEKRGGSSRIDSSENLPGSLGVCAKSVSYLPDS